MHRITIEAGSHGVVTTVSEMRKRLAKILAPMQGDQEVFFTFVAHLEPRRPTVIYAELARPENE
jgi:hypothetical protein